MPRNGLGIPMVSSSVGGAVLNVDDVLWESFGVNEIAINYAENYTNVVLYSQDTTQAEQWTKTNTAIDSTLYEAPDNSTTANAIKSNSTGEKAYNISQGSLSVTAGKTYTLSVHVKKGTLGFARVYFSDGASKTADFNLNTAAVTNTSNTIRTQVDSMDDDWYRCSITFQATSTTSSGSAQVFALSAAGDNTPNVAVSGVILLYVWGFQLEENIEASPYIVTTTEARTATETLNDLSSIWDFDSANLMPEETPNSEGVWETSGNIVLNHDYEELGSELVTNGTFDADSDWSKVNATISGGKGNLDSSGGSSLLFQSALVVGKNYKATLDVSNYNSTGVCALVDSNGTTLQEFTSNGSKEFYFTHSGSNTNLTFRAISGGVFSIDNVSVKQVDPNDRWVSEADWTIEDGVAKGNGASGSSEELRQDGILTVGDTYEFTFTIQDYSSGSVELMNSGLGSLSSNGVHTGIGVAASTDLRFRGSSFNGSIDNVTVREYAIQPQDV